MKFDYKEVKLFAVYSEDLFGGYYIQEDGANFQIQTNRALDFLPEFKESTLSMIKIEGDDRIPVELDIIDSVVNVPAGTWEIVGHVPFCTSFIGAGSFHIPTK